MKKILPDLPYEMYAIAWRRCRKIHEDDIQESINCLLESGYKFMVKHTIKKKKELMLIDNDISDYIVDENHEFWNHAWSKK